MKPSYGFLLAALVAAPVLAQSPPAGQKPADGGKPMVLLLDDFQIVEGAVERVGDGYRVRRGKELQDIPGKRVLASGESRAEVYREMMARGLKPTAPSAGDYNSAAFRAFPTRVQPVLMNLCASCHAKEGDTSGFKLVRVAEGFADPEASDRNAKAVARFITRDDPSASPVLTRAVTAHGDQRRPALLNRSLPAYRNLEQWVYWAAASQGPRKPTAVQAEKPTPAPAKASSEDPFDPDVFNRAMHPGSTGPGR